MPPNYSNIDADAFARSLRFNFVYDPTTGLFTRRVKAGVQRVGDVAGYRTGLGYICIEISGKQWRAHVLAFIYMTGRFPAEAVDHINRDGLDNRWENLREATHSQNSTNRSVRVTSASGITGVYFRKDNKTWQADITVNKVRKSLGSFATKDQAVAARKIAEAKYHGEFAAQE